MYRYAKMSATWKFIVRTILSGLGIFACLFLINIVAAVLFRESEVFLVISIALPSSLFVVSKLQKRGWLYAGMSQSIGSFIVILVLIVFLKGGGEMEAIFVATYMIVGFFFGVIIGLVKASVIFIIEKLSFKWPIIILTFVLSSSLFSITALAAGPWKGRIIDMEMKEPLEGAVVLAVWERVYRTPAGPNSYFYEAKEVLTDKEGRFEIPSYSPINLLPIISFLRGPHFTVFKPGYLSLSSMDFGDFFLEGAREAPLERKEIGGKTYRLAPGVIELPKLKTREERIRSLNSVEGFPIDDAPSYKIKKLLELIDIENKNLGFKK